MNILSVHNKYKLPGGEDHVREAECSLLRDRGHKVIEYTADNDAINGSRPWALPARAIWSATDYRNIRAIIRDCEAEIVAVHNFFPLISPSAYYAAHAEGIPVVQTLHNYRIICAGAFLIRDGRICEDCLGKSVPWPAVVHGCYRNSRLQTAALGGMTSLHMLVGTWHHVVDRYIALTDFMRDKFVHAGFDASKISVRPNFTYAPEVGVGSGSYFVYVGRLSSEKGVATLLKAWQLANLESRLKIMGTGPEELTLKAQASAMRNVEFLGHQSTERLRQEVGEAKALIFPSLHYEAFGTSIIEAFAKGTPVIASNHGSLSSLVTEGLDGFTFPPGDSKRLSRLLIEWPDIQRRLPMLRTNARETYERRFSPEVNYDLAMEIYTSTISDYARRAH